MGKGNNTTTTAQQGTTNSTPNPVAMQAYQDILGRAQGVAQTPYQSYGGEMVAPINSQQYAGIGSINQNAGYAQPFIGQAAQYATNAAQPLSASDIQRYQNPYTQQVVNATEAQFNNQNAQQQQQVLGNAASQGALGGDRVGVAQANLAGQQALAQNPVIAGLYSQGYQQAVGTAQQQQQNQANAAYSLGNLGVAGQNAALTGAGAMLGAGSLEQQNQQQQDAARYGQFQQQQAFPYQQTQWLAGLGTGLGSQMGGTSQTQTQGTQTGPPPNVLGQMAGLGIAGVGAIGQAGGWGGLGSWLSGRSSGGAVRDYDAGGSIGGEPFSGVGGYIPGNIQIIRGSGAPPPPNLPGMKSQPEQQGLSAQQISGLGTMFKGWPSTDNLNDPGSQADIQGILGGLNEGSYAGVGAVPYRQGGAIRNFAPGGAPDNVNPYGDPSWEPRDMGPNPYGDPIFPANNDRAWSAAGDQGVVVDARLNEGNLGLGQPVSYDNPALAADRDLRPTVSDAGPPAQAPGLGYAGPTARPPVSGGDSGVSLGTQVPAYQRPETSPWGGVLAAGLGMMASRSPFLGNVIGEGGLTGLAAYGAQQKQDIAEAEKKVSLAQKNRQIELHAKQLADAAENARKTLSLHTEQFGETQRQHRVPTGFRQTDAGLEAVPGGPHDPATIQAEARAKQQPMNDTALEIGARQMITGDMSPLTNIGKGAQGDAKINALRAKAAEILTSEYGMSPAEAATHMSNAVQQFRGRQIGISAGARTGATREANLDIILKATDAAIPAAIEASDKVFRTGFVPLNKIIQKGEVMTSNPELREFGMANLQLAEHWARAMNPTGVMRESDRDKALDFLSTADTKETYRRVVAQLQKQIQREKAAVASGGIPLPKPVVPGGRATSEPEAAGASTAAPAVGERKQFKQGWGVWNGTAWAPEGKP